MNWQHLNYFLTVAKTENFSKAARELFISTSALSKAIKNLENEIGLPLFEKSGRNSILNQDGKIFKEYVYEATQKIEAGLQFVHERNGLFRGHIRLSGNYTMNGGFLPSVLTGFRTSYPDITYFLKYNLSYQTLSNVLAGITDLGFCGNYSPDESNYKKLDRYLLYKENIVVIAPKDHWLAKQKYIDFRMLAKESFITFLNVNAGGMNEAFWNLSKESGFIPKITFEVPDDYSIVSLVSEGHGIAIVPDSKYLKLKKVAVIEFKDHIPQRKQYMVWRKDAFLSLATKALRDYIMKLDLSEYDSNFDEC